MTNRRPTTFAFVTLGCDKNTVDSERYLAQIGGLDSVRLTTNPDDADVIVVNTCGFIDAAKQESIDALVAAGQRKAEGSCRAVVAVGCMVERHRAELVAELPEVDLFLGTSETERLVPALAAIGLVDAPDATAAHPGMRVYAGDRAHVRYLKISEGCDHGCAFCAIPLMRGRHRSFARDVVIREAQWLEAQGAREVNLVAQDLAHYGRDRRDGTALPELLESLLAETAIPWLRLLYLYSAGITPRLLEVMAREPRVLPYIDMPMQHGSDAVLARMRRPERAATIRARVAQLRAAVPDVAIRTTCIVGFPGETADDFDRLCDLLEEIRFERVGAFTYSAQEGTRAAALNDDVPMALKHERLDRLTELQRAITGERYERHIGRVVAAIIDRPAGDGVRRSATVPAPSDPGGERDASGSDARAEARLLWQADDVDGVTQLAAGAEGESQEALARAGAGTLVEAVVERVVDDYDFEARLVRVLDAAPQLGANRAAAAARAGRRALPVMGGAATTGAAGSFGR